MNGKSYKWLMKSLGSLSLASAVVMLPIILAGCSDDSSSSTVPLPPPPPPAPPPAPPAPPAPPPTPTPANLLLSVTVTRTSSGGSGLGELTGLLPGGTVTGVAIDTSIRFRFGTPVNVAPFLQAIRLVASSGASVAVTCTETAPGFTEITCTPNSPLVNDQTYTLTVTAQRDLFADGRPLFPTPQTFTFTTGETAVGPGPITFLATQQAAVTPNGQIFSSPVTIPVGYGIRRASPAQNVPVGVYTDYRSVLSFPIPASIPTNAVVSRAQLTLVQLPSNDSVLIGGADFGRGFFFLDPTPSNVPANNVVFQEVTLGAANNVVSSDFFAPASTPSFIALSINGNVLGGDVSAGPRTADVAPGVQRAVSGSRFYQVRLQCAKEVWNNQAFPVWVGAATAGGTISVTATITQTAVATASTQIVNTATGVQTLSGTGTISGNIPVTFSSSSETQTVTFGGVTISGTFTINGLTASGTGSVPQGTATIEAQTVAGTIGFNATVTASASGSVSRLVTSTGTASVSVTVPGVGTVTAIGTTSVPATVTSTVVNSGFEVSQGADGVCRAEFDKGTPEPLTTSSAPRLDVTFTIPR